MYVCMYVCMCVCERFRVVCLKSMFKGEATGGPRRRFRQRGPGGRTLFREVPKMERCKQVVRLREWAQSKPFTYPQNDKHACVHNVSKHPPIACDYLHCCGFWLDHIAVFSKTFLALSLYSTHLDIRDYSSFVDRSRGVDMPRAARWSKTPWRDTERPRHCVSHLRGCVIVFVLALNSANLNTARVIARLQPLHFLPKVFVKLPVKALRKAAPSDLHRHGLDVQI